MGSNFQHPFKLLDGFGARLREAREEIGLSQKELAAAGGVTRYTQVGYENEATDPNTG
jgi:transcriptional regulator with XRE-family HTH domain